MAFCTNCGKQNPEGSTFCSACGSRMIPASAALGPAPAAQKSPTSRGSRIGLGIGIGAVLVAAAVLVMSLLGLISFGKSGENDAGKPAATQAKDPAAVISTEPPTEHPGEPAPERIEGEGFDSPEAVAAAYVEAWARQDLDAMLATFAIETQVEHDDRTAYNQALAEWLNVLYGYSETDPDKPMYDFLFPVGFPITATKLNGELSVSWRTEVLQKYMRAQYLTYALRELDIEPLSNEDSSVSFDNEEAYRRAVQLLLDPQLLSNIKMISFRDWKQIIPENEQAEYQEKQLHLRKNTIDALGMEDYVESVVELELDGQRWLLFLDQAKYNGKWYNYIFNNNLYTYFNPETTNKIGLMPAP